MSSMPADTVAPPLRTAPARSRFDEIALALEFFCHMRVIDGHRKFDAPQLMDLRDGKTICVAYLRNSSLADEFNAALERLRFALAGGSATPAPPVPTLKES